MCTANRFAAIANAAYAKAAQVDRAFTDTQSFFETYLRYSFDPGYIPEKIDSLTRR